MTTMKIPLFPLNTVLFPNMPLALHIFEERYKKMVGDCVQNQLPFGVVLIAQGQEAQAPDTKPHPIGCTAHISQLQRLGEGRMNILAIGRERFRILELDQTGEPYLQGIIENYPLADGDNNKLQKQQQLLQPLVEKYLSKLATISEESFDELELPEEPLLLAYLAAMVIKAPSRKKQDLLTVNNATQLLDDVRQLYRTEIPLLDYMMTLPEQDSNTFSLN